MDSYTEKFQSMQQFVPFLNKMIFKIQQSGDKDKEPQLVKMKSLHEILTNPAKKVRIETLLKCEEVLQKLYEKVEGVPFKNGVGSSSSSAAAYQTNINKAFNDRPQKPAVPANRSSFSGPAAGGGGSLPRPAAGGNSLAAPMGGINLSDYLQSVHEQQHFSKGENKGPGRKPEPPWSLSNLRPPRRPSQEGRGPFPSRDDRSSPVPPRNDRSSPGFPCKDDRAGPFHPRDDRVGPFHPRDDRSPVHSRGDDRNPLISRNDRGLLPTPTVGRNPGMNRGFLGSGRDRSEGEHHRGFLGSARDRTEETAPNIPGLGDEEDLEGPKYKKSEFLGGILETKKEESRSFKRDSPSRMRTEDRTSEVREDPRRRASDGGRSAEAKEDPRSKALDRGRSAEAREDPRRRYSDRGGGVGPPAGEAREDPRRRFQERGGGRPDEVKEDPRRMGQDRRDARFNQLDRSWDQTDRYRSPSGERSTAGQFHQSINQPPSRASNSFIDRYSNPSPQESSGGGGESRDRRSLDRSFDRQRSAEDRHRSSESTPRSPSPSSLGQHPRQIPLESIRQDNFSRAKPKAIPLEREPSSSSLRSDFRGRSSPPRVSPDTRTVSPQVCSPDTQTASPETPASPAATSTTSGGRRTTTSASPSSTWTQDTPASPDTVSSPGGSNLVSNSSSEPKEIPTIPIFSKNLPNPVPTDRSIESSTTVRPHDRVSDPFSSSAAADNRRRDPRQKPPPPVNVVKPTTNQSHLQQKQQQSMPAYMSNIVGGGGQRPGGHPAVGIGGHPAAGMHGYQQQQQRFPGQHHPQQGHDPRSRFQQGYSGPPTTQQHGGPAAHRLPGPSQPSTNQRVDPRLANRQNSTAAGSGGGGAAQPRNYREYRQMKEEQERRRRDAERKHREMMMKYERPAAETSGSNKEAAEAVTATGGTNEEAAVVKPEAAKPAAEADNKPSPKVDEKVKPKMEPVSKGKSKDPRLKDPAKKVIDEKKTIEQLKKSFKIPKLKKAEPIEDAKVKDDKSKLKVIDMFNTDTKQSPSKKSAKKDTRESVKKEDTTETDTKAEPPKQAAEKPTTPRTGRIANRLNSESSDSDHDGLTIAEDTDTDEKMDTSSTAEDKKDAKEDDENPTDDMDTSEQELEAKPGNSKSGGEGIMGKEELTKELLKNIVATLDPTEAAKLLMKAQKLDKLEKLTLDELKEFLCVKEGGKAADAKTKGKGKRGKEKSQPGPRRSGRLRKESTDEPKHEDGEKDSDVSDTETLVIEPKEVKVKKKRGRKPKNAKEPASEKGVQDDMVSSSNIEHEEVKAADNIKVCEPAADNQNETLAAENPPTTGNEETAVEAKLPSTATPIIRPKPAAAAAAPKAPKSKTWFPGDNRGALNRNVFAAAGPKPEPGTVKAEAKEADKRVFFGEDEKMDEVLKTEFEISQGKVEAEMTEKLRKRYETVDSYYQRLQENTKLLNKMEAEETLKSSNDLEPEKTASSNSNTSEEPVKLCSKIKLCRPPVEAASTSTVSMVDKLELKVPDVVKSTRESLISKLQNSLKLTSDAATENVTKAEDVGDGEESELPNLASFLKNIRRSDNRRKLPPPALIPLHQLRQVEMKTTCLPLCSRAKYSPSLAKEFKSKKALDLQTMETSLSCLFRCMSFNCSFATNSVAEFRDHVTTAHEEDKFGSLRCSVCLGKASEPQKLIKHILARHGHAKFQCVHCFTRTSSRLDIHLHLNMFHPELPQSYVSCQHIEQDSGSKDSTGPVTHPLSCPVSDCKFTCDPTSPADLVQHIRSSVCEPQTDTSFHEYLCVYCTYTNTHQVPVLIHQTLSHPDQEHKVLIRETDLSSIDDVMETDSSDSEASIESTSDSEVDQDFHDEGIDALEDTERMEFTNDLGLSGNSLYKCGNHQCEFSANNVSAFKDHLLVCECSEETLYYTCVHCHKQFKHPPTLIEHLKSHAVKRFFCSLCEYKSPVLQWTRSHMKLHKVSNIKLVGILPNKNNADEDCFVMVPKSSVPKGAKTKVQKDTYGVDDVSKVSLKPEVGRNLLKCALCDFSSKVRRNLIKHLNLHMKKSSLFKEGEIKEVKLPMVAPVNPPTVENNSSDSANYSRMKSLLAGDEDEELSRAPMSEEEISQLPKLVSENVRYACGVKDCRYITIDEVMLQYHIQALHAESEVYNCPHCTEASVPLEELSFHLRCHGELLFKCGFCSYYHWQKRTAEKHVAEQHVDKKLFVRNVRSEEDSRKDMKKKKKKETIPVKPETLQLCYEPYKCGLCEQSSETQAEIMEHCASSHQLHHQYKCAFCTFTSNQKTVVEGHYTRTHRHFVPTVLKVHYVDPRTCAQENDPTRRPLWSRDMVGVKHIRGILYADDQQQQLESVEVPVTESPSKPPTRKPKKEKFEVNTQLKVKKEPVDTSEIKTEPVDGEEKSPVKQEEKVEGKNNNKLELDFYPLACRQCQMDKKTVSGMKMHIKLVHLQLGRYHCNYCTITANLKRPMIGHIRKSHPESVAEVKPEEGGEGGAEDQFTEVPAKPDNFTQEYWKSQWGIPTITERRSNLSTTNTATAATPAAAAATVKREPPEEEDPSAADNAPSKRPKVGPKRGRKRKKEVEVKEEEDADQPPVKQEVTQPDPVVEQETSKSKEVVTEKPSEMSPFEKKKSYMCSFCPKRSQCLDRLQRHLTDVHPRQGLEYRELSRDQVVHIITSDQTKYGSDTEYKCFYCHESGDIKQLRDHSTSVHVGESFRVTKCQNKGVSGYLECQICGHLSPGFEKSNQKAHFHEEHPLENEVRCSKYMFKHRLGPDAFTSNQQAFKFDVREVEGIDFLCPKEEECSFSTKSLSQMNNHLRKHTRTYKCGHCGKTLPDSSEFHRHSALSHGDKIPDLVKDPEAEAEYEALKGILEWGIQKHLQDKKLKQDEMANQPAKLTARKSMDPNCRAKLGDKCRNVSRKSMGPQCKYWKETRLESPYTFYRVDQPQIDPRQVKTKMAMGGMEITLDVEKMSQLVNLQAHLVLKDCVKESIDREELDL